MLLFENISLAFTAIFANKTRSLLTMLGIIIGIGSVIAIGTVGNSLTASFTSEMESMGSNNITVQLQQKSTEAYEDEMGFSFMGPSRQINYADKDYMTDEMISDLLDSFPDTIKGVALSKQLNDGTITNNGKDVNVNVFGVNAGNYDSMDYKIVAGHDLGNKAFDGAKGVCIISDVAAKKLFKEVNEALEKRIQVVIGKKFYEYTVVGVYEFDSDTILGMADEEPTTDLVVPIKNVQKATHSFGYTRFTVFASTGVNPNEIMPDIEEFFDKYYHSNKNFTPVTSSISSVISSMTSMLSTIQLAITIIAGISLIVGGIGVMNIMLVSISERTREIGTRKALGATNASIRTQFIVESMILCLIGGAIGIIIGVAGGSFAASKMGYAAKPSVSNMLVAVGFSLLIGVFFGYYPANKAAKMNPIDALRYE